LAIAFFAGVLSGCSGSDVPGRSERTAGIAPSPEDLLAGSSIAPALPGTGGHGLPSAETCKGCHEREYGEWKESYHSQSVSADTFRAMYTIFDFGTEGKRPEYCFTCHAPESRFMGPDYVEELSRAVLAGEYIPSEGITCAACHMVDDVDPSDHSWIAPAKYRVDSVPPYHALFRSDLTQSSAVCSSCHDYDNINIPHPGKPETACCTTNRELAKTDLAGEGITCQSCHMRDEMDLMPAVAERSSLYGLTGLERYLDDRGVVSHLMPGSRSEEMLKKAVRMSISGVAVEDDLLVADLEIENLAGHPIPDG
jgi:Cytochrome c554 and c-prime